MDLEHRWLIDDLLVADEALVIGGIRKSKRAASGSTGQPVWCLVEVICERRKDPPPDYFFVCFSASGRPRRWRSKVGFT